MTSFMLDTNICSFLIRKRPPEIVHRLERLTPEHTIATSAVVYFELCAGANAKGSARLHGLIAELVARLSGGVLPFDEKAAERAAAVDAALSAKGTRIGDYDIMIAGHALAAGCTLVTNNTKEFKRLKGLEIEDWS
jgi:tRNA(fMet)-specific endonuclease VapC